MQSGLELRTRWTNEKNRLSDVHRVRVARRILSAIIAVLLCKNSLAGEIEMTFIVFELVSIDP